MNTFNKIKRVVNQLFSYGLSQLIVILIPIILLPILTRALSIVEFADYAIYKTIVTLLTPIIGFALPTYLLKNFYSELKNKEKSFLVNAFYFSLIITLFISLISCIFPDTLIKILKINQIEVVLFGYFNTFLFSLYTLLLTVYRAKSDVKQFLISNTIVFSSVFILVSIFLLLDKLSLRSVLIIHSLSYLAVITYGLIVNVKINKNDIKINSSLVKSFIRFSIPLALYSLFMQLVAGNDRMIINFYLGKQDLAIFASTFQLAFAISAVGGVLQLAWSPYIFKKLKDSYEIDSTIIKYFFSMILFMIFFCAAYYLFFPTLMKLFLPKEYFDGLNIFVWFILAGFFQVVYWMVNPFLIVYEKRSYLLYIAIATATISITLNLIFTKNGIEYAAFIYFVCYVFQCFMAMLGVYYAKKNLSNN